MKENGVYERLYKQEPQRVGWYRIDNSLLNTFRPIFSWKSSISGYGFSDSSRNLNKQKLWTRATIPWSLSCDRGTMPRQEAADIFSMRLDHLGFMNYVIALAVIVALLVILPFIVTCCQRGTNDYLFSPIELFITRALFAGAFIGMLLMINEEREQCRDN